MLRHHPVDIFYKEKKIEHRLTRPFSPQTNGMVERFNRRINEVIGKKAKIKNNNYKNSFHSHEERNCFLEKFVYNYNRTRLSCINYKSPVEMLCNHAILNTKERNLFFLKEK